MGPKISSGFSYKVVKSKQLNKYVCPNKFMMLKKNITHELKAKS